LALLDIGSCYNPFGTEDRFKGLFDVTALDLCPVAGKGVRQCDFLGCPIERRLGAGVEGSHTPSGPSSVVGSQLVEGSFDVAVMSLVLSYLPDPIMVGT